MAFSEWCQRYSYSSHICHQKKGDTYGAYGPGRQGRQLQSWGSLPEHLWLIQEARHKSMVLGYCLPTTNLFLPSVREIKMEEACTGFLHALICLDTAQIACPPSKHSKSGGTVDKKGSGSYPEPWRSGQSSKGLRPLRLPR